MSVDTEEKKDNLAIEVWVKEKLSYAVFFF